MKLTSLFLPSLFFGVQSFAAGSGIQIGELNFGGTGCKAGTVTVDQNSLKIGQITFKDFKLNARKGMDRKACNISIPLDVPKGVQVGIGPIDQIKGSLTLPNGSAKLKVNQEVFFAGLRGKVVSFEKKGAAQGALKIENSSLLKDLRWSECGQAVSLRVSLIAQLESPSRKMASANLDSMNILKTGRLYWRSCQ